jgi:hypothetical protein
MQLTGKVKVPEEKAVELFNQVWETKKKRDLRTVNCQWVVVPAIYIDGSLTFVTLSTPYGDFFGFSKFNCNDDNYSEMNGIYKALSRAVDHLLENI